MTNLKIFKYPAKILRDPNGSLDKKERQSGMTIGKIIKPALLTIPRDMRADAVTDAAALMSIAEDGLQISPAELMGETE